MNKILYIGLLATSLFFMTSCEKDEVDIIESETQTTTPTETETTVETTQMTLRINNTAVLSSDVKGLYCAETEEIGSIIQAGVTNTGYYISELNELEEHDLEVNDFVMQYVELEIDSQDVFIEYFISYVDLGDGQGPIHVASNLQLIYLDSHFSFDELSETNISGTFDGIVYKIHDIDADFLDIISNLEEIGDYELTFETSDLEICPE